MGGDTIVTNEEYNYLALMADDGLLHVGGRPVDVDECGCGHGHDADAVATASPAQASYLTVLLPGGEGEGPLINYAALTLAATSSEAVCMAFGQILSPDVARMERAKGERVFHSDQA